MAAKMQMLEDMMDRESKSWTQWTFEIVLMVFFHLMLFSALSLIQDIWTKKCLKRDTDCEQITVKCPGTS